MMRHETDLRAVCGHDAVWELLPWFVNGTLSASERLHIDQCLASCTACREELAQCRAVQGAVTAEPAPVWTPSPASFATLMTRLGPTTPASTPVRSRAEASQPFLARLAAWWGHTPSVMQWALVAQVVVLVGLSALYASERRPAPQFYETLSSVPAPSPTLPFRMRVVFAEDLTEKDLRALLTKVGGRIVDGPSPIGVYAIEVGFRGEAGQDPQSVVAAMRAHPSVRLVEPASPR